MKLRICGFANFVLALLQSYSTIVINKAEYNDQNWEN